jgi:CheY-specific phosphatase CheX
MSTPIEALSGSLLDATGQVFQEHGVVLQGPTRCEPALDWLDPIAVIGFGGDSVRGCVSFEVPWRVLQGSHPMRSTATVDLVDWVGELANLTLGKLKTMLRRRGVRIQLGLPTTFTVPGAQSGAMSQAQAQFRLGSEDGGVRVRLSAEIDSAFRLAAPQEVEIVSGIDLF